MKFLLFLLFFCILVSCDSSPPKPITTVEVSAMKDSTNSSLNFNDEQEEDTIQVMTQEILDTTPVVWCGYEGQYKEEGNRIVDTFRRKKRLIDPIDDFENFEEAIADFVTQDNRVFRKARTHYRCGRELVDIEYYQDFTGRIDIDSYKEYDKVYFTTMNQVYFWWVNSSGHLMIPIVGADPKTFKPFDGICGGKDKNGVFYGCPNFGVYKLAIPVEADFKFIPQKDNYWNSPHHYVVVDDTTYNIRHTLEKGYFCAKLDSAMVKNE